MDHSKTKTTKKRSQIAVACNECRKRKIKCNGERPHCVSCVSKQTPCSYEADPDATPIIAIKRKYADLQRESASDHQIIEQLVTQSEVDALVYLRDLRARHSAATSLASVHSHPDRFTHPVSPATSVATSPTDDGTRISLPSFHELTRNLSTHTHRHSVTYSASSASITPEERLSDPLSQMSASHHFDKIASRANMSGSEQQLSISREDSGYDTSTASVPTASSYYGLGRSGSMAPSSRRQSEHRPTNPRLFEHSQPSVSHYPSAQHRSHEWVDER